MSARKPRRAHSNQGTNNINNPRHHQYHPSQSGFAQPSDYDSDYQTYLSDTQHPQHHQQQQQQFPIHPHPHHHQPPQTHQQLPPMTTTATTTTTAPAPPPLRTNEDLNLSVLRRHNPTITSILSLAQYAVVYIFSPSTRQWEKSGVEGTLFVCQRSQGELGEERYSVFVLNRRGLNNFDLPLTDGDNVEITEEYIILKSDLAPEVVENASIPGMVPPANSTAAAAARPSGNSGGNGGDIRIYGLWIYSEPPPNSTAETRSINAQMIRECAVHAGESLKLARERVEATRQNGMHVAAATAAAAATTGAPLEEVSTSVAMGRQVSLKDLFGQQRAQDDGWSVRAHQIAPADWQHAPPPPSQPGPGPGPGSGPGPAQAPAGAVLALQQDVLGDLFRRAGLAYQGAQ